MLQQIFLVCKINFVETKTRRDRTENKIVKPRNSTTATQLDTATTTTTKTTATKKRKGGMAAKTTAKPH